MNIKSCLRGFIICAVVAIPASIIFPHLLTPNDMTDMSGLPHSFGDGQFWLMWLPWYAAFLITSSVSAWLITCCKRKCRSHDGADVGEDYDDEDDAPRVTGPREIGTVKWFNGKKGFGFITREDGEDIFVHHRSIRVSGRGRRFLNEGQKVEYTVTHKGKGPQAEDVVVL